MLLRARCVYPMVGLPIEDGYVRIIDGHIVDVGLWSECGDRNEYQDLGDVLLLPGLINAHCHLEYTNLVGAIPPPESFTEWIQAIIEKKAGIDDSSFRQSWLEGARQALDYGTTTMGNVDTRCDLLPSLWAATPLRIISFIESILFENNRDVPEFVGKLKEWLSENKPANGKIGVSPHAPYTTKLGFLRECGAMLNVPMSMHIAESSEENQMFRDGGGDMWEMFCEAGRDVSDCGGRSPLAGAIEAGLLDKQMLLVHGNYLDSYDIAAIAKSKTNVVHCPRSHDYFRHRAFPAHEMKYSGVNLCLGTDSLVTMRDPESKLELFSEMRLFRDNNPGWSSRNIIEMVTINPAKALGMEGEIGCLNTGAKADLLGLHFDTTINSVEEMIIEHRGPVELVMVEGQSFNEVNRASGI